MPTTPSILVVGAGLTGAAVSRALRRSLPAESIIVWEALGAVGGRMQTERVSVEGGALGLADTGAQYVTVTDDAAVATAHDPLYNALLDAGILMPMVGRIEGTRSADGGGKNYIAPAGVAAIVEHLFRVAGVRPVLGRRATGLYRAPPVAGGGVGSGGGTPSPRGRWEVSAADGTRQAFDGVVLTQPAPHMLSLLDAGDTAAWLPDATPDAPSAAASARRSSQLSRSQLSREKLRAVEYSARYALTLFFPPSAAPLFGANLDWISKYVTKAEDDALVYLSVDWAKRGGAPTEAISLVAHSSVPYGVRMMAAGTSEAAVLAELRRRVYALLPWLPPNPSAEHLQPWPLSQKSLLEQVRSPITLSNGWACARLYPPEDEEAADEAAVDEATAAAARSTRRSTPVLAAPVLVLAGDAFSALGSRFDGCVQSGEAAAAAVLEEIVI
eukprot:jgi/Chrpa1/16411/Chrysochromulina_OHIO_Genome00020576-RA